MPNRPKGKKTKFGMIGCSRVARKNFLPAISDSKEAELKIIGSRTMQKAKSYAEEFNCKIFGTYDDVLNSDVDAVYISLPIGLNEKWTLRSAKASKHVLCEKSLTTSYLSAKKMVSACKKKNVRLLEGFAYRFHPQHTKVLNLIKQGKIGKISTFSSFFGFSKPSPNDIRWNKKLGGGVLNDAGCYPIAASRLIFEELPIGLISNLEFEKKSVDSGVHVMMFYPKNKIAHITARYGNYFQSTYTVWGSKGIISTKRAYGVPRNFSVGVLLGQNDKIKELKIPPYDQTRIMIDRFSNQILGKNKCDFSFEDELLIQAKIMDAVRLSNKEKKIVNLKW